MFVDKLNKNSIYKENFNEATMETMFGHIAAKCGKRYPGSRVFQIDHLLRRECIMLSHLWHYGYAPVWGYLNSSEAKRMIWLYEDEMDYRGINWERYECLSHFNKTKDIYRYVFTGFRLLQPGIELLLRFPTNQKRIVPIGGNGGFTKAMTAKMFDQIFAKRGKWYLGSGTFRVKRLYEYECITLGYLWQNGSLPNQNDLREMDTRRFMQLFRNEINERRIKCKCIECTSKYDLAQDQYYYDFKGLRLLAPGMRLLLQIPTIPNG